MTRKGRPVLLSLLACLLCLAPVALGAVPADQPATAPASPSAAAAPAATPGLADPQAPAAALGIDGLCRRNAAEVSPLGPIGGAFVGVCTISCTPCPCRAGQGICGFRCGADH